MLMHWKLIIVIITTTYIWYTCTYMHASIYEKILVQSTLYIVHFIMLLCHGIKLEGRENVEDSSVINCEKGLEVRGEVNAPFLENVNTIL